MIEDATTPHTVSCAGPEPFYLGIEEEGARAAMALGIKAWKDGELHGHTCYKCNHKWEHTDKWNSLNAPLPEVERAHCCSKCGTFVPGKDMEWRGTRVPLAALGAMAIIALSEANPNEEGSNNGSTETASDGTIPA